MEDINCLKLYLNEIGHIGRLTEEEEKEMFSDIRKNRERIISAHLQLAASAAKKFMNRGLPYDDLLQEATLGLMYAVDKYDVKSNNRFSTYAYYWMEMYMSRAIANKARVVRLPVHTVETVNKVRRAHRDLTVTLEREPTAEEIAEKLKLSLIAVEDALGYMLDAEYLDTPISPDEEDTVGDMIADKALTPEESFFSKEKSELVAKILDTLKPKEKIVITKRFGLDGAAAQTLKEIGESLGITSERVRQIEADAMVKLRHPSRANALREYMEG